MRACFGMAVCLFLIVAAQPILEFTAGPEFVGAAPLMIVQAAAVAVMLISFPTRSALLAMGHQRQILNVELISTPVFYLVALPLIHIIGAMGANRSEEHTSELQSLMRISYAVFCFKKQHTTTKRN